MSVELLLAGRRALVTAGPTWVPLDRVRVITSIFSGNTGLSIARAMALAGAEVTLLMGPGNAVLTPEDEESMQVRRFRYFNELESMLEEALEQSQFDVIVHSAAVADYEPAETLEEKIPSGFDELQITLKPTRKLVRGIRESAPGALLVQFKLETGKSEEELIDAAWRSLMDAGGELVVANLLEEITETGHRAYIIDPSRNVVHVNDKGELSERLVSIVSDTLKGKE